MLLPIAISNHCDLDCAYCCITNKDTSPVLTYKQIADFLDRQIANGHTNATVEWFGGEPTLHFSTIAAIMNTYPNFEYKIITNGQFEINDENIITWSKFDEVLISLDGIGADGNRARKLTEQQFATAINNVIYLSRLGVIVGVGSVISRDDQFRSITKNVEHFYNMGAKYFALELVTVMNDDKPVYITQEHMHLFVNACLDILEKSMKDTPIGLSIPRELISGNFYFNKLKGDTCGNGVRALSPRGNTYLCRDHAADEEGLIKNSESVVRFKGVNDSLFNIDFYQEKNGNFKHLDVYNEFTSCPVKSMQYEAYANKERLWWLQEEDNGYTYQQIVIQPLWTLIELNNSVIKEWLKAKPNLDRVRFLKKSILTGIAIARRVMNSYD